VTFSGKKASYIQFFWHKLWNFTVPLIHDTWLGTKQCAMQTTQLRLAVAGTGILGCEIDPHLENIREYEDHRSHIQ